MFGVRYTNNDVNISLPVFTTHARCVSWTYARPNHCRKNCCSDPCDNHIQSNMTSANGFRSLEKLMVFCHYFELHIVLFQDPLIFVWIVQNLSKNEKLENGKWRWAWAEQIHEFYFILLKNEAEEFNDHSIPWSARAHVRSLARIHSRQKLYDDVNDMC